MLRALQHSGGGSPLSSGASMPSSRPAVRLSLLAFLAGALAAPVHAAEAPAKPPAKGATATNAKKAPKRYTIEQFMATTTVTGATFSKDEKQILFSSNESGIFNVYTM